MLKKILEEAKEKGETKAVFTPEDIENKFKSSVDFEKQVKEAVEDGEYYTTEKITGSLTGLKKIIFYVKDSYKFALDCYNPHDSRCTAEMDIPFDHNVFEYFFDKEKINILCIHESTDNRYYISDKENFLRRAFQYFYLDIRIGFRSKKINDIFWEKGSVLKDFWGNSNEYMGIWKGNVLYIYSVLFNTLLSVSEEKLQPAVRFKFGVWGNRIGIINFLDWKVSYPKLFYAVSDPVYIPVPRSVYTDLPEEIKTVLEIPVGGI